MNTDSYAGMLASSAAASLMGGFNPVTGIVANVLLGVAGEFGHAIEDTLGDVPVFEQIIAVANWVADGVDAAWDFLTFWD